VTASTIPLRRVARFAYGDSLSDALRQDGDVPVYGSNGQVGTHAEANTLGPVLIVGRKGSFGKVQYSARPVFAIDTTFYIDQRLTNSDLRWLFYVLQTLNLDVLSEDVGVPGLSRDRAYSQLVPCYDLGTQQAIADDLDRETARLGALIAAKRRQIALLGDRCLAVSQQTIDEVPTESLPLRRVVGNFVDYRGATPEKAEEGVPLITATNVAGGVIDLSRGEQFVTAETYVAWMRRGFPEVGDVLLTTEAPLGEVAAIEDPYVALAQRIILLKPNRRRIEADFLRVSLMSPRVQADLLSRASGSTVWGIRSDRLRDVRLDVPSLTDQKVVLERVSAAEATYGASRELFEQQMRLLSEHRSALITAAVTGQLRIPEAA
jgi:type I restriction enzyme S subunit